MQAVNCELMIVFVEVPLESDGKVFNLRCTKIRVEIEV